MIFQELYVRGVYDAREQVLGTIIRAFYGDERVIYVDGWNGFGAVPVLRSIAQELLPTRSLPPELCFDKIIYLDCSVWESRRMMQRKIADELNLGHETTQVFDKADEEDDFNGVDHGSRDVIKSVAALIYQTLRDSKSMMIIINGGDDEIDVTSFGFPMAKYLSNILMWTFNTRLLTVRYHSLEIQSKLRGTQLFLYGMIDRLSYSEFTAVLHEEATSIIARHPCMRGIDPTFVTDCCLYTLFLHCSFSGTSGFDWTAHAYNYWMCAGITRADTKSEVVNALCEELHWTCNTGLKRLCKEFMKDSKASPFLVIDDYNYWEHSERTARFYETRPYHWVCITAKYLPVPEDDLLIILEGLSSLLVLFESSCDPCWLEPVLYSRLCSNLAVLTLCFCTFSFVSPPFLGCETIKFLGLEHCTDSKERESKKRESRKDNWAHLQSLLVLDLRNTDWDDILSEQKLEIMKNLMELNIEGSRCWEYISQLLHNRLPLLEKLRIINPIHQATIPTDTTRDSLYDKKGLQVLDLSGNKGMKDIQTSITSNLEVLVLDGCDELETVVLSSNELPSSLRSFSFDGYGSTYQGKSMVDLPPEIYRPQRPPDTDNRDIVKTLKISLQGFKQLENLFLRGLPNLEELDLSGSTIKILDFNTMVIDVPRLKRLFLLGCEHLRAIIWSSNGQPQLELLCIDTRPGWSADRPSLDDKHNKSDLVQVHAIIVDARLARSLKRFIQRQQGVIYFNIRITMSAVCGGGFVPKEEATGKEMVVLANQQYGDVSIKDAPSLMEAFPQPPGPESDRHIGIGDGSRNLEGEMETNDDNLGTLMIEAAESMDVHDSSRVPRLSSGIWRCLKWCRVARCPNLDTIFPAGSFDYYNQLQVIWASDLPMARYIWGKGLAGDPSFENLQHLHLRHCPRLQFVLPVSVPLFPNMKTLHVIHCGDLVHVFVLDDDDGRRARDKVPTNGVSFPKLTTVHLYDLPKLRQISEVGMLAPALETIKIRGCFNLRRLPSLKGREPGVKKPAVEMEKDVWNALEWDGLAAGHHRDLFQPLVHSRHYRRRLLRTSVLR